MSKELPFFKFDVREWLTGEIVLEDMELQGVFINVCATYWNRNCSMTMERLTARYGEAIGPLLEKGFITQDSDSVHIKFLDEQWASLTEQHKTNVQNGIDGAEKRWGNSKAIALKKEKKIEDIEIDNTAFDLFWSKYPTKKEKNKCLDKWKRLKQTERDKILETLDAFLAHKPFPEYNHPNPLTYLNRERWLDEMPKKTKMDWVMTNDGGGYWDEVEI